MSNISQASIVSLTRAVKKKKERKKRKKKGPVLRAYSLEVTYKR